MRKEVEKEIERKEGIGEYDASVLTENDQGVRNAKK